MALVAVVGSFLGGPSTYADLLGCPIPGGARCVPGKVGPRIVCAQPTPVEFASVSAWCTACHDGSIAGAHVGHPVEVLYPRDSDRFRDVESLPTQVELTWGQVTCETCHPFHDADQRAMTRADGAWQYCLACHVK